jgi:hypothetical protein
MGRKDAAVPPKLLLNYITAYAGTAYYNFSLQLKDEFQSTVFMSFHHSSLALKYLKI